MRNLTLLILLAFTVVTRAQSFNQLWVSTGVGYSTNVFKVPFELQKQPVAVKSFMFGWERVIRKNTSLQIGLGLNQIGYTVILEPPSNLRIMALNLRFKSNQFVLPVLFNFSPLKNQRWRFQTGIMHGLYRTYITTNVLLEGDALSSVFASNGYYYAASMVLHASYRVATIKKTDFYVFTGVTPIAAGLFFDATLLCSAEVGIKLRFKQIGEH